MVDSCDETAMMDSIVNVISFTCASMTTALDGETEGRGQVGTGEGDPTEDVNTLDFNSRILEDLAKV